MIYRQTANPNATNSELDAKIVITKEDKFEEWLSSCPDKLTFCDRFIDVKSDVKNVALVEQVSLTDEQLNNVIVRFIDSDWSHNNDVIYQLIQDELEVPE